MPDNGLPDRASPQSAPAVIDLGSLPAVACPCGTARRGFAERTDFPGTIHLTQISEAARTHFHTEHTEVYVVLQCHADARIELDGETYPVRPKTAVLIPPGTRHRALGEMEVLILCLPKFDPQDEHFDDSAVPL